MKVYIGPYKDKHPEKRKINIRIDKYDTWNMDHTLALLVLPMLKQLKDTKHGAPFVDQEDVPDELKDTPEEIKLYEEKYELSKKFFKRWDYIIGEMIYAFESEADEDFWDKFYTKGKGFDMEAYKKEDDRVRKGFEYFGKYYRALWD